MQQIDFFLPDGGYKFPSLGDGEPIPPGPYRVGMLWDMGRNRYVPPYTIVAANGRVVFGHIDNLDAAAWACTLMNASPAPTVPEILEKIRQEHAS